MSQEVVRRIYVEISTRQEFPREWFDPACVADFSQVAPEGGPSCGVDSINAAIAPCSSGSPATRTRAPHSKPWAWRVGSYSILAR
jgi:hypothetical protein